MTAPHRGSRRAEDRLSAESYYDLLAALTLIKAHAQMVARSLQRAPVPDGDAALHRLQSIDRVVGELVTALDAMPVPPEPEDDAPTNGAGPA